VEQSGVLAGPINKGNLWFTLINPSLLRRRKFGNPEVAWFKSRPCYFLKMVEIKYNPDGDLDFDEVLKA